MILRCSCGAPATHKVEIQVAPVGATVPAAREPGALPDFRWGYFSADHVITLLAMRRHYARIGLDIVSYEIKELV
jgi:hypothetical protein